MTGFSELSSKTVVKSLDSFLLLNIVSMFSFLIFFRLSSPDRDRIGHHRSGARRYHGSASGVDSGMYDDKVPPRRSNAGGYREDQRNQGPRNHNANQLPPDAHSGLGGNNFLLLLFQLTVKKWRATLLTRIFSNSIFSTSSWNFSNNLADINHSESLLFKSKAAKM